MIIHNTFFLLERIVFLNCLSEIQYSKRNHFKKMSKYLNVKIFAILKRHCRHSNCRFEFSKNTDLNRKF